MTTHELSRRNDDRLPHDKCVFLADIADEHEKERSFVQTHWSPIKYKTNYSCYSE